MMAAIVKTGAVMAHLILTYRLKPGVTPPDFEAWVRATDYPAMRGLKRVKSFTTYRIEGPLFPGGTASPQYVELFDIPDLEGFGAEDVPGPVVQDIMGQFAARSDGVEFMIASEVV
jgi:hypothetical protein